LRALAKGAEKAGRTIESRVSPNRFHSLHEDGRKLIADWLRRAEAARDRVDFEAFIYSWISFNGWATCCCAEERDRIQLDMMMFDDNLAQNFNRMLGDASFREAAQTFRSLWPVFRVADLSESVRRNRPQHGSRERVIITTNFTAQTRNVRQIAT